MAGRRKKSEEPGKLKIGELADRVLLAPQALRYAIDRWPVEAGRPAEPGGPGHHRLLPNDWAVRYALAASLMDLGVSGLEAPEVVRLCERQYSRKYMKIRGAAPRDDPPMYRPLEHLRWQLVGIDEYFALTLTDGGAWSDQEHFESLAGERYLARDIAGLAFRVRVVDVSGLAARASGVTL
ncbi:hypothetical protein ACERK3_11515 [Phycisphaerales bacterium AB-hyl4]|uniref:Uncharacterized protein n=1 Tax=Natronomicrosphaera hydrolytica TaxID=3242702 RepID=A0ABV4U7V5_9BACT